MSQSLSTKSKGKRRVRDRDKVADLVEDEASRCADDDTGAPVEEKRSDRRHRRHSDRAYSSEQAKQSREETGSRFSPRNLFSGSSNEIRWGVSLFTKPAHQQAKGPELKTTTEWRMVRRRSQNKEASPSPKVKASDSGGRERHRSGASAEWRPGDYRRSCQQYGTPSQQRRRHRYRDAESRARRTPSPRLGDVLASEAEASQEDEHELGNASESESDTEVEVAADSEQARSTEIEKGRPEETQTGSDQEAEDEPAQEQADSTEVETGRAESSKAEPESKSQTEPKAVSVGARLATTESTENEAEKDPAVSAEPATDTAANVADTGASDETGSSETVLAVAVDKDEPSEDAKSNVADTGLSDEPPPEETALIKREAPGPLTTSRPQEASIASSGNRARSSQTQTEITVESSASSGARRRTPVVWPPRKH